MFKPEFKGLKKGGILDDKHTKLGQKKLVLLLKRLKKNYQVHHYPMRIP